MKIKQKEVYEELAAEWQYQMIKLLKETISKHKIKEEIAKKICVDFTFNLAMLQDQGLIKYNKKKYRPVICFENKKKQLFYKSKEKFQLHDYAHGNTAEIFEE